MGYGLTDVELVPDLEYNLTSYFGCYRKRISDKVEASDPNAYFFEFTKNDDKWGCKGSWQGKTGTLYYLEKDPMAPDGEKLTSLVIEDTDVSANSLLDFR